MHITQAVILAAGKSSRFEPFAQNEHKALFSLKGKSILEHTVESLLSAQVKNIIVIKNAVDTLSPEKLLPYQDKATISFVDQKNAQGMADALLQAKSLLQDSFIVLNPQHMNIHKYLEYLSKMQDVSQDMHVFCTPTTTPWKYGIVEIEEDKIISVIEKPDASVMQEGMRIVGIYHLSKAFVEFMSSYPLEEYLLEKALNDYAKKSVIRPIITEEQHFSLKYAWDLFPIMEYLAATQESFIHPTAKVHPTALIDGNVYIGENAQIYEYSIIHGPVYIGPEVVIGSYCKVRSSAILERKVQLQNQVEVKHSYLGEDVHIHSGFIGDSIIGKNGRIGADFVTANRRLDRKPIACQINGKKVSTEMTSFGALIGPNSHIGIHCGTNPGKVLTDHSLLYPGTII